MARCFLPNCDTGIVNSGATHLYIPPIAPHSPPDTITQKMCVVTATGHVKSVSETAALPIPQLVVDFSNTRYIMPSFINTLTGIGFIWYYNCIVLFENHNMKVFSPGGKTILILWREKEIPKLWHLDLWPSKEHLPNQTPEFKQKTLSAYSVSNLPITESLVWYMHTASGFPVKSTWIRAKKRGNFETWLGLTY